MLVEIAAFRANRSMRRGAAPEIRRRFRMRRGNPAVASNRIRFLPLKLQFSS